jgi:hypothetical protein
MTDVRNGDRHLSQSEIEINRRGLVDEVIESLGRLRERLGPNRVGPTENGPDRPAAGNDGVLNEKAPGQGELRSNDELFPSARLSADAIPGPSRATENAVEELVAAAERVKAVTAELRETPDDAQIASALTGATERLRIAESIVQRDPVAM